MTDITRRNFVAGLGAGLASTTAIGRQGGDASGGAVSATTSLTPAEALEWHRIKDSHGGPTYTGSVSWKSFVAFVEAKLAQYGCVDQVHNRWEFDRWVTSDWPDDSNWGLTIAGEKLPVASYGANSGSTPPQGLTAGLVVYDPLRSTTEYAGKIVIVQAQVTSEMMSALDWDYEYASPTRGTPQPSHVPKRPHASQAMSLFAQITQFPRAIPALLAAGAVGSLFVLDAGVEQAAGMYTFPVPAIHQLPSLFLDRNAGERALAAAERGEAATIRLAAKVERAQAAQTIAFLPGRRYGHADDEVIQLTTHTDGPSISQDNGALGLLGVIKYLSQVPQAQRSRTLMVFLDCRHYMPGDEHDFAQQDWFVRHPAAGRNVVGLIHMEHLGQLGYYEVGDRLVPTGVTEPFSVWATNNQQLVDLAIRVVQETGLPGAMIRNVDRPGIHGRSQGPWFGLGAVARQLGIPAFGIMGLLGAYWSSASRVDRLDPELFVKQVETFARLTTELMAMDLASKRTEPVAGKEALKLVRPN